MRTLATVLLALTLVGCKTTPEASPGDDDSAPAPQQRHRVMFVGIDGVRPDALQAATTPNLDALLEMAAWTMDARTHDGVTSSAPGWTSIFTGVQSAKHGVPANGEYDDRDDAYPTFVKRAVDELGITAALAYQWLDIGARIVEAEAVAEASWADDPEITTWMVERVVDGDHDLHALVMDDVDHAGHEFGFSATAQGYLDAIAVADTQLGQVLAAMDARPEDEAWLLVVTTDHGGTAEGSHGDPIEDCQRIWMVVAGDGVTAGELPAVETTHLDVHPTILKFLGLDIDAAWDLDGTARGI
jgi:predicted AlkP superfamily pyrophosphatase or phosphodiesterase